jgi:hypothetical protein
MVSNVFGSTLDLYGLDISMNSVNSSSHHGVVLNLGITVKSE